MTTDKIPGQLGFLILNDDGAVLSSGGDLENDELLASKVYSIVKTVNKHGQLVEGISSTHFHKLSIHYGTHVYSIVLSNKKFHVFKYKYLPLEPVSA